MSTWMSYTILFLTLPSIVAELVSLFFPERILAMFFGTPEERKPATVFSRILAVLSMLYAANLLLMLCSGDDIFQLSVLMIISLGVCLWSFKRLVVHMKPIVMIESTCCLVLLVNVAISILRMRSILAF